LGASIQVIFFLTYLHSSRNAHILNLNYSSVLFSNFSCVLSTALIFISFPLTISYCCLKQQQKHYSITKNRSELSYPHREHVSGTQGYPHKQSKDVKETENNLSGHFYNRPSHSGPLFPGSGWVRGMKEVDNGPTVSNRVNLSKLSGLVASRTLLSEDQEPKPVPSFPYRKPIEVRKSVEATNGSESRRRRDKKRVVDQSQIVNRRVPTEKSTPVSYYSCYYLFLVFVFSLLIINFW